MSLKTPFFKKRCKIRVLKIDKIHRLNKMKKIKCKNCDVIFTPKSDKNVFHNRRCFKQSYYNRKKLEELNNLKFPSYKCQLCSRHIELDFDPMKDDRRWLDFTCPFCGFLMISVVEEIVTQEAQNI